MTWQQFEQLVGEAFGMQGYSLVQCKQWRAYRVGIEIVRELYRVMAASGAAGGFVVTSGTFNNEATAFAQGRNIKLVDGPQLHRMLQQAKAAGP